MSRYIDADIIRDEWLHGGENEHIYDTNDFLDSIDYQPTADVEPVRHARWIGTEYDGFADGNPVYDKYECSNCGATFSADIQANYCPHCGARMDEEEP